MSRIRKIKRHISIIFVFIYYISLCICLFLPVGIVAVPIMMMTFIVIMFFHIVFTSNIVSWYIFCFKDNIISKKRRKLKKQISILENQLQLESKKTIKHRCINCKKKFVALYYQEIKCKYCGKKNITIGVDYTPISKKLDKKNRLLSKLEN